MIVNFETEGLRAARHRLADAAHADDADAFAREAAAEHPCGRPARPLAFVLAEIARAFRQAARHGEDEAHGHVGGIFGQHAGRVRYRNAAAAGRLDVDIVDAGAELRDEAEVFARLGEKARVDPVGHGRNQDIGLADGDGQFGGGEGMIVGIQPDIEQLAHARLDGGGQLAGDDDERLFGGHEILRRQSGWGEPLLIRFYPIVCAIFWQNPVSRPAGATGQKKRCGRGQSIRVRDGAGEQGARRFALQRSFARRSSSRARASPRRKVTLRQRRSQRNGAACPNARRGRRPGFPCRASSA